MTGSFRLLAPARREDAERDQAMQNIDALLRLPHVGVLGEDDGFWEVYGQVVRGWPARGNQVPDAHLAALLRQHGVDTLYTSDSDFRRFEFLTVVNPPLE